MADWNEWIATLLSKTDIMGLVSKYVSLNRKGGTYWGCCPFHHEKTPSFTVSPDKGMFYCFGCSAGGNAITFLSKIESMSKFEAIKTLAEAANMTVPEREGEQQADSEKKRKQKQVLLALLKDTARFYYDSLKSKAGEKAREYLTKRGINDVLIAKFGLGYSPGFEAAIDFLRNKGYEYADMRDAGIAAQKADSHYDVFARRLMVPIIDQNGDVVAFGGRILEDGDFAKYRNSSQTPVFDKSRTIFAINLVKRKKQKEGIKYIVLCEGYMDVIALHKAGFDTAAASMGTSLTNKQARLLKSLCDNVYISFDGDSAGQRATLRGLDILTSEGLNVKVVVLPEGMDPDDVVNKTGAEGFKRLMEKALPLPAFKIESLKKSYDLSTPDGKSAFAVQAVNVVKLLDNPVEREEYLKIIQAATGYSMKVLFTQADLVQPEDAPPPAPVYTTKTERERTEGDKTTAQSKDFILASLSADKPYADLSEDFYSLLVDDESRRVFGIICEARRRPNYSPGQLYSFFDEGDEETVNRLLNYDFKPGDGAEKYGDCINNLKRPLLEAELVAVTEQYNKEKDIRLLKDIDRLSRKINDLKRK
ncbi:MAG: DNA primase [Firmicutes bacterium]|nr:DNA primase [Bacillota bacterium]